MRASSRPPVPDGSPPVSATLPTVLSLVRLGMGAGLFAYASCLLASFLICLFNERSDPVAEWVSGFLPSRSAFRRELAAIGSYRPSPRSLFAATGASLVANLTLVAVGSLAILALNPEGLSTRMCLVIPMGFIARSLPHTPGWDWLQPRATRPRTGRFGRSRGQDAGNLRRFAPSRG